MNMFGFPWKKVLSDSPLWFLGANLDQPFETNLLQNSSRLIWCSYRHGFEPITPEGKYTSDAGWGCMFRTGQMIFAAALLRRAFSIQDWANNTSPTAIQKYKEIINLFQDSHEAPFSIHRLSLLGTQLGKPVGDWFGPSTISSVLSQTSLVESQVAVKIYNSSNSIVSYSEISRLCSPEDPEAPAWKYSVLILIPTRLGINGVNPIYSHTIKAYLALSQSLGFIGGRPNASYYFFGMQDETLFYLDPHQNQKKVSVTIDPKSDMSSYFYRSKPPSMNLNAIDECLALGFFCRDIHDYRDFAVDVNTLHAMRGFNALFSFGDPLSLSFSTKIHGSDWNMTDIPKSWIYNSAEFSDSIFLSVQNNSTEPEIPDPDPDSTDTQSSLIPSIPSLLNSILPTAIVNQLTQEKVPPVLETETIEEASANGAGVVGGCGSAGGCGGVGDDSLLGMSSFVQVRPDRFEINPHGDDFEMGSEHFG